MIENINELVGTEYAQKKQLLESLKVQANCFVGWVDTYNAELGTINVQPAIQSEIYDKDNAKVLKNKPFLVNVWVVANTLSRNPQRGDKALIWVLDEKSNNFFKSTFDADLPLEQQTMVSGSREYKTLSNCVAIIVNPQVGGGGGSNSGLPLGTLISSTVVQNEAGLHLADGTTINQEGIYAQFATWLKDKYPNGDYTQSQFDSDVANYGQCGHYVIDNTAGTIRLPKITRYVEGLTNLEDIGKAIKAGLPNITGSQKLAWNDITGGGTILGPDGTGAFYKSTTGTSYFSAGTAQGSQSNTLNIDASRSNSIYGNSNTVQTDAIRYPYYIVVATGVKLDIEVDIDNIVTDLNAINATLEKTEKVFTIYDMTSSNTSLNWGKSSGIRNGVTISNLNFSTYKKLIIYHQSYGVHGTVFLDLSKTNTGNKYSGSICEFMTYSDTENSTLGFIARDEVNLEKTSITCETYYIRINNGIINSNDEYYVYRIEGVE